MLKFVGWTDNLPFSRRAGRYATLVNAVRQAVAVTRDMVAVPRKTVAVTRKIRW